MATYAQWARSKAAPRRLTWVCGPEAVLREEVVTALRDAVVGTRLSLSASVTPEREVWDACAVTPLPGMARLVVVRDAERLGSWDTLASLAAGGRELAGLYLVLVSAEPDYTRRKPDSKDKELLPGPAVIQAASRGQIIKCVLGPDDRLDWVAARLPQRSLLLAEYILSRVDGDLAAAAAVCSKLALLGGSPGKAMVAALCAAQSRTPFEDSLICGDTAAALRAAPAPGELGKVIGLLASRLDVLTTLFNAHQQELGTRDIVTRFGVPQLLVAKYRQAARNYPPARVQRCHALLAELDASFRSGVRAGIPEALVALW